MKNTVYCHVKAGKTVLSNPRQFAEYANSIIDILYVGDDDLLYDINEENVKAVPGTLKVRHVERKITGNIAELLFCTLSNTANTFIRKLTYSVGSVDNEASDVTERQGESTMHAISDKEPSINNGARFSITPSKWYAVFFHECQYWFVGRVLLSKWHGNFLTDFLQQMTPGDNLFTNVQDQQIACKDLFFYELTADPLPVSSSRANCLKLSEKDFAKVLSESKQYL